MALVTAEQVLAFAAVKAPTAADQSWASDAANAVNDAVSVYLDWGDPLPSAGAFNVDEDVVDGPAVLDNMGRLDGSPEAIAAARLAASELYRRRDAPFGTTGYIEPTTGAMFRVARDYLESVKPILFRYRNVAGNVA